VRSLCAVIALAGVLLGGAGSAVAVESTVTVDAASESATALLGPDVAVTALAVPVRVEETAPEIKRTARWTTGHSDVLSGGSFIYATEPGQRISIAFNGTSVSVIGNRHRTYGSMRVSVDGEPAVTVDLRSVTTIYQQPVWGAVLAEGAHVVTIEVVGDGTVGFDAADIVGSVTEAPEPVLPTRVEQSAPEVLLSDGWTSVANASMSGGSYAYARTAGARAAIEFTGTSVAWIGPKYLSYGQAEVVLDGVSQGVVSQYAPALALRQVIWSATGLSDGNHRLEIRVLQTKEPASTFFSVCIDAFDIEGTVLSPAKRFEEDAPGVLLIGSWSEAANSTMSGGSYRYARAAGADAYFFFEGQDVAWIGPRFSSYGRAEVFLDGVSQGEVSQYSASYEAQAVIWSAEGLDPGAHELHIRVLGTKDPDSAAYSICVDAFETHGQASASRLPQGYVCAEQDDPLVTAAGLWSGADNEWMSGGSYTYSRVAGASYLVTFTGSGVAWIGPRYSSYGQAEVVLDGVSQGIVSQYAPTFESQRAVWSISGLGAGEHVLEIRVLGTREALSRSTSVCVDAFLVDGVVTQAFSRIQQSAPGIGYGGGWYEAANGTMSGGSYRYCKTPGSAVRFAFEGTEVRWIGPRFRSYGEAEILLDGVSQGVVDLYSAEYEAQSVLWWAKDLADTAHVLEIRVLGTAGRLSMYDSVCVDAFDIRGRHIAASTPAAFTPAQEDDARLTRAGMWYLTDNDAMSAGRYAYTRQAGASLTVAFTGTGVRWIAPRNLSYGRAEVFLDGISQGVVSLYAPDLELSVPVWEIADLPHGEHTLVITALGTKDEVSTGTSVCFDGVHVTGSISQAPVESGHVRTGETASLIAVAGPWASQSAPDAIEGAFRQSRDARSRMTIAFTGRDCAIIGTRGPDAGMIEVFLDGVSQGFVDLHAHRAGPPSVVWSVRGLANTGHEVSLRVAGRRDSRSSSYYVRVDAFEHDGALAQADMWFDEDDYRYLYAGTWSTATGVGVGDTVRWTGVTGSAVTVRFTGRRIEWVTPRGPAYGIARVSVDGGPPLEVDLYAEESTPSAPVWTSGMLSAGVHTVRIECTGLMGPDASGARVAVDGFEVIGEPVPITASQRARTTIINTAIAQLGKPYVWGREGPSSFDCSGLVRYCYLSAGISVPHYSVYLWRLCDPKNLTPAQLLPADLCFTTDPSYIHHVGLFVGDDVTINAPGTGKFVEYRHVENWGCYGRPHAAYWP
jgi:cell wall-associated NlpC family hydrolase